MIRISQHVHPTAWYPVQVDLGEGPVDVRVRFRLLEKEQVALWQARRLALAAAIDGADAPQTYALLREDVSPEHLAEVEGLLREAIVEWEIGDADSDDEDARLPVNAQTLSAVLRDMRLLRALFRGLVDASAGVAARKNASTGSAGG